MVKVLLVDDEPIFRMGLRSGIQWQEISCKVVGEAKNGEEALLQIDQKKPDLVLLDLKMPKMDGIEVLTKMKTRQEKPKFIVLSCFNEYEYVREAMKLGASDYLFKPLMEGKDIAAIIHEIFKNTATADNDQATQISYLLESILAESDFSEEKKAQLQALCPMLGNTPYFIFAIKIPGKICNSIKKEALLTLCKSVLIRCFDDKFQPFFCQKDLILYGLFFYHSSENFNLYTKRKSLWEKIKEYVEVPIWIGCSDCMLDKDDLKKAMDQATIALQAHFFSFSSNPADEFLTFHKEYTENKKLSITYKKELKIIEQAFGKYRLDIIKNTLMEICNSILSQQLFCEKDFPHMLADSLINNMRLYQHRDLMEQLIMKEYNVISNLYHQETMEDTYYYYIGLLEEIFALLKKSMYGGSHSDTIQSAISYMKAHYSEKISLSDMARKANMSDKYFCKLFKDETDETFVGYLTNIRIQAAERMLMQTDMRTYEVAEQVGFGDYHHFAKTYKKITGKTPTETRIR